MNASLKMGARRLGHRRYGKHMHPHWKGSCAITARTEKIGFHATGNVLSTVDPTLDLDVDRIGRCRLSDIEGVVTNEQTGRQSTTVVQYRLSGT